MECKKVVSVADLIREDSRSRIPATVGSGAGMRSLFIGRWRDLSGFES